MHGVKLKRKKKHTQKKSLHYYYYYCYYYEMQKEPLQSRRTTQVFASRTCMPLKIRC